MSQERILCWGVAVPLRYAVVKELMGGAVARVLSGGFGLLREAAGGFLQPHLAADEADDLLG